jgi:hypothetical protein
MVTSPTKSSQHSPSRPSSQHSLLRTMTPHDSRPITPSLGHFKRRFLGDDDFSRTTSFSGVAGNEWTPTLQSKMNERDMSPQKDAILPSRSFRKARHGSSVIVGSYWRSERPNRLLTGRSFILEEDSKEFHNILVASKEHLVSSADPDGDFSWRMPMPEAYMMLPQKLVQMQDWSAFAIVMCDLRFLCQKMVANGILSIIDLYQKTEIPLENNGIKSSELRNYNEFFCQNARLLQKDPLQLFPLALSSKIASVRCDCEAIVDAMIEQIDSLYVDLCQDCSELSHVRPEDAGSPQTSGKKQKSQESDWTPSIRDASAMVRALLRLKDVSVSSVVEERERVCVLKDVCGDRGSGARARGGGGGGRKG